MLWPVSLSRPGLSRRQKRKETRAPVALCTATFAQDGRQRQKQKQRKSNGSLFLFASLARSLARLLSYYCSYLLPFYACFVRCLSQPGAAQAIASYVGGTTPTKTNFSRTVFFGLSRSPSPFVCVSLPRDFFRASGEQKAEGDAKSCSTVQYRTVHTGL